MRRATSPARPGLAALICLALFGVAVAAPTEDQARWLSNNIEPGADMRLWLDDNGATFLRRVGSTPLVVRARRTGYRNAWVRFETVAPIRRGAATYYSVLAMKAYDCEQHRVRAATTLYYAEHNLTGRSETVNRTGDWLYITPGTADASILEFACGAAGRR